MSGLYDLPAKSMICNIKQFNGEFGCPSCFHPGKKIGRVRKFPLDQLYPLKTHNDSVQYSTIADSLNENDSDE